MELSDVEIDVAPVHHHQHLTHGQGLHGELELHGHDLSLRYRDRDGSRAPVAEVLGGDAPIAGVGEEDVEVAPLV